MKAVLEGESKIDLSIGDGIRMLNNQTFNFLGSLVSKLKLNSKNHA